MKQVANAVATISVGPENTPGRARCGGRSEKSMQMRTFACMIDGIT
jgi:hypothetical protein